MKKAIAIALLIAGMVALSTTAAARPVNDEGLSCTVYDHHDLHTSEITYADDGANDQDGENYFSPGEEVVLKFNYNLPACDNAADHSRHVITFYNSNGEVLGKKVELQMRQGNWGGPDDFTVYHIPITIPEFNTSSIQVRLDIYGSSVHGSDVYKENPSESAYDKVIQDTVPEEEDALGLEELPINEEDITMLQNLEHTGNFRDPCVSLPENINNNSYVDNPDMPGFRIADTKYSGWYMDSGGWHPCYIFTGYEQARAMYNWYDVIDYGGSGDNEIGKASTCGPNTNRQHNGGGNSLGHTNTFKRACPDYDGEWISDDVACDSGTRKKASEHEGELIKMEINGETQHFASDGNQWYTEKETDASEAACDAFLNADQNGNWASGDIVAEASGKAGARCNLDITNDKFIVDKTLYEDGDTTVCDEPGGVKESVTIDGTTYYCKGIAD